MELRLNPEWLRNQDTTVSSILYLGHPLHSEQCNSAFAHGKSMIPSSGNLVACRHSHCSSSTTKGGAENWYTVSLLKNLQNKHGEVANSRQKGCVQMLESDSAGK
jgi:hypothetical protein